MNTPCPDCQTELTPSIMGHLCHGCGAVYSFEKMSSIKATSGSVASSKKSGTEKKAASIVKPTSNNDSGGTPKPTHKNSGVRHHLKKFLVPEITELPKPVDESHLLSNNTGLPSDNTPSAQAVVAAASVVAESKALDTESPQVATEAKPSTKVDSASAATTSTQPGAAGSFDEYMEMIGDIDDRPSSSSVHQSISYAPVKKNFVPIIACIIVAIAGLALVILLAFNI